VVVHMYIRFDMALVQLLVKFAQLLLNARIVMFDARS
jgi:hypothetical protein